MTSSDRDAAREYQLRVTHNCQDDNCRPCDDINQAFLAGRKFKQEQNEARIEELKKAIIAASEYSKAWGKQGMDMFAHGDFRKLADSLKGDTNG